MAFEKFNTGVILTEAEIAFLTNIMYEKNNNHSEHSTDDELFENAEELFDSARDALSEKGYIEEDFGGTTSISEVVNELVSTIISSSRVTEQMLIFPDTDERTQKRVYFNGGVCIALDLISDDEFAVLKFDKETAAEYLMCGVSNVSKTGDGVEKLILSNLYAAVPSLSQLIYVSSCDFSADFQEDEQNIFCVADGAAYKIESDDNVLVSLEPIDPKSFKENMLLY